ncbi:hypothetical protein P255_01981 [Acinetobacter brisouii CIP 110357]|uniref:Uncharacterized protein n=1 Tax=Acinetobacter brisouii CIP 110357 TaxID=1341683 RepID=V2US75_9GAMM|nr:hypothetical protein [Acinetobacter brisouii]ENV47560.1 hypothetical protein F954_00614 [Acinetobacter brisouii ANC 4119]ESK51466.1 hypothetical protein P255_01981 [Acinetobacter brisouii CIP 110357]
MTTTAYDTHFIASDIAFTDQDGVVNLSIPFRKVKRIGSIVIGMAGCLNCMIDFCEMAFQFVSGQTDKFDFPIQIQERTNRDFIAMIYVNGSCLKLSKIIGSSEVSIENITQIPTVIGSGSQFTSNIIEECPNAVVAVLEAIKHDKYTDGEVKYCSIRNDTIHNLELHPMSQTLKMQLTGMQQEIQETRAFLGSDVANGKNFSASTETYHKTDPATINNQIGMSLLREGFEKVRNDFK